MLRLVFTMVTYISVSLAKRKISSFVIQSQISNKSNNCSNNTIKRVHFAYVARFFYCKIHQVATSFYMHTLVLSSSCCGVWTTFISNGALILCVVATMGTRFQKRKKGGRNFASDISVSALLFTWVGLALCTRYFLLEETRKKIMLAH